jgi:hypothetical protein
MGNTYRVLIGKPEARKSIGNLEVDGRILKSTLNKLTEKFGTPLFGSEYGQVTCSCENGKEQLRSIQRQDIS